MTRLSIHIVSVLFVAVAGALSTSVWADGNAPQPTPAVRDQERTIRVAELRQMVTQALDPVNNRWIKSGLPAAFAEVDQVLAKEPVDKDKLITAVNKLHQEMGKFTENWSEVTDPIWQAQDALNDKIAQCRLLIGQAATGHVSPEVEKKLANHDRRLTDLATRIKNCEDEKQKARLTRLFASTLELRDMTSRMGDASLAPAMQAINTRVLAVLGTLNEELSDAMFQLEATRMSLQNEREFLGNYADMLNGLKEVDQIAALLNSLQGGPGSQQGDPRVSLAELSRKTDRFHQVAMNGAEQWLNYVEEQLGKMPRAKETDPKKAEDIDKAIERYSRQGAAEDSK